MSLTWSVCTKGTDHRLVVMRIIQPANASMRWGDIICLFHNSNWSGVMSLPGWGCVCEAIFRNVSPR